MPGMWGSAQIDFSQSVGNRYRIRNWELCTWIDSQVSAFQLPKCCCCYFLKYLTKHQPSSCWCVHMHTQAYSCATLHKVLLKHISFSILAKSGVLRWLSEEAFARTEFSKLPSFQRSRKCLMVSEVPSHICQHGNIWQIIGFHCIVVV